MANIESCFLLFCEAYFDNNSKILTPSSLDKLFGRLNGLISRLKVLVLLNYKKKIFNIDSGIIFDVNKHRFKSSETFLLRIFKLFLHIVCTY
jgi:hypothetical protein